jgi:Ca2+-binding RTX toxin-like protein
MSPLRRTLSCAAIALLLALAVSTVAAAAGAAGISGRSLTFQGAPGTDTLLILRGADGAFAVNQALTTPLAGTGCENSGAQGVRCSGQLVTPPVTINLVRVLLGAGSDSVILQRPKGPIAFPAARINGGPGDDDITSSDGSDIIVAGFGVNSVRGNDGTDRLLMRNGRRDRLIDCGNGVDSAVVDRNDPLPISCETVERPRR